jgi:hypothetical protein
MAVIRWIVILGIAGLGTLALGGQALRAMAPKRPGQELREEALEPCFERLKPLHAPKTLPQPGEWLASHPEKGQSVAEYKKSQPVRPKPGQATLYLQPIGAHFAQREHPDRRV